MWRIFKHEHTGPLLKEKDSIFGGWEHVFVRLMNGKFKWYESQDSWKPLCVINMDFVQVHILTVPTDETQF